MTASTEITLPDVMPIDAMTAAELAALLFFHGDAGVEWLLEDAPVDRIAVFAESQANRGRAQARDVAATQGRGDAASMQSMQGSPQAAPKNEAPTAETPAGRTKPPARGGADKAAARPVSTRVAIPDEQAVAEARTAAGAARSLAELREALETFTGCNLRNSARNLVFAEGDPASGLMIIGPAPNGDDDRDGRPFSGRQGDLLDRMVASIGLKRETLLLTNVIPWRPPGNRMPSARELEICRPFLDRQFALAQPKRILVLGNFAARFLFGGHETIHDMRGQWRTLLAGGETVQALATLHPHDLISAPICKRLAWQDLQLFARGSGPDSPAATG